MATKSSALRNSQADGLVANIDKIEVKDTNGNVLGTATISGWTSASSGQVDLSSDVTITGNATAGSGTDITEARLYDSGSSGEEISGLTVTQTGNGGDIELENTNLAENQDLTITSLQITEPSSTQ